MLNLTNERYGRLLVLKEAPRDKNNKRQWLCKCDCGKEKIIRQCDLRTGKTQSCGCLRNEKTKEARDKKDKTIHIIKKDLTGKQFSYLTVLEYDNNYTNAQKKNILFWKCKCKCGNICYVSTSDLNSGHVKSCGCLQKENWQRTLKIMQEKAAEVNTVDRTGQKYGLLTALKRTINSNNKIFWICKCECGNIVNISSSDLSSAHTQSCGCLKKSTGELKILQILEQNKIPYKTEVSFDDLKFKHKLRYDFAILNNNGDIIKLIEYDGIQHFDKQNNFYSEELVIRDKMKNDYAKNKNIPLLRIPYYKKEDINLNYLLYEKTF